MLINFVQGVPVSEIGGPGVLGDLKSSLAACTCDWPGVRPVGTSWAPTAHTTRTSENLIPKVVSLVLA